MKSLLIIGYGQYGHVVEELASECGYGKIAALDDNANDALDKISAFEKYENEFDEYIVAIGNPTVRKEHTEKIQGTFKLATLIHPTAYVSKNVVVKAGCIIEPNVVIHMDSVIEKSCIINAGAVVNHHSKVEAYCQIGFNSVILARSVVPNGTKVGHLVCFG